MVRTVFLKYLAMFLLMHRPHRYEWQKEKKRKRRLDSAHDGSERENGQSFRAGEFVEMSQTKVVVPPNACMVLDLRYTIRIAPSYRTGKQEKERNQALSGRMNA